MQNARVAGREIGYFLQFLHEQTSLQYSQVHLIGYSLGGHTAGYAGESTPGVGRISGKIHCLNPLIKDRIRFRNAVCRVSKILRYRSKFINSKMLLLLLLLDIPSQDYFRVPLSLLYLIDSLMIAG